MEERRNYREITDGEAPVDHRGLNWSRTCLVGSIFVFLGLAILISRWLPEEYVVQWVLVYFSAESAFLLVHVSEGSDEDETC
jgi:hypothetical protein